MIQLIYRSQATRTILPEDIISILNAAENKNGRAEISGLLVYHNNGFMQLLEGPPASVYQLLEMIKRDRRHHNLAVIVDQSANTRCMPLWAMAFGALESQLVGSEKFFIEPGVLLSLCEAMPDSLRQHFMPFLQDA